MRFIFFFISVLLIFNSCSNEAAENKTDLTKTVADTFCDTAACYPVVHDSLWLRLDTLFRSFAVRQNFSGCVLIAKKGKIIYKGALGWADASKKKIMTEGALFQLASVSKTITAIATLMLKDRGKLNLNDNIKLYFPEFPYENITVERLLAHRTGLPNYLYFLPNMQKGDTSLVKYGDVLRFMIEYKPEAYSKPNVRFQYCNTNYVLLANLIEKVSGMTYEKFIRENIFEPLQMKSACFLSDSTLMPDSLRTSGHTFNMKRIGFDRYDGVLGDKGIYASVSDLFLFEEAVFNYTLISEETLALALSPHNKEKISSNYGFGFRMRNFNSGNPNKIVFHNGWWHGYRTAMQRRLRDETTIIILGNSLNKSAYQTWKVFTILDSGMHSDTTGVHEENSEE